MSAGKLKSEARPSSSDEARARLVEVMRRVADRDRAAFRDLYGLTSAKLYGVVLRILRDEERAKDVLQDVYVKIWNQAGRFDPAIASPITWLAVIARNRALDEVRKAGISLEPIDGIAEPAAPFLDPLDGRANSEELRRLRDCLSGLTDERRSMVLLAYYHGLSREALSQRFARPVGTIKTLLHRSLAQVRECLSR